MAPLCSEPRQLLVVLNLARRKALYQLVKEITAYMRSQLELEGSNTSQQATASPTPSPSASSSSNPLTPASSATEPAVSPSSSTTTPKSPVSTPRQVRSPSISQRPTPPTPSLVALRRAALAHFDKWRQDVLAKLEEVLAAPKAADSAEERRARAERLARLREATPNNDLIYLGDGGGRGPEDRTGIVEKAVAELRALYHPVPTRLTTIPVEDRAETLSGVVLVLLSGGSYVAESRALAVYLTSALGLPLEVLVREETEIARAMVEGAETAAADQGGQGMSAEAEAQKRKEDNKKSRYWKVGLASVAGATVIGITGGLAAPVVAGALGGLMGSLGLGGVASFLGVFWMNGALVGTLFGAFGARMTGEMMDKYAREVEDFRFLPLKDEEDPTHKKDDKNDRKLRVTIGVNGWLTSKDEVTKPWQALGEETEAFALRYEMDSLLQLGQSLEGMVSSYAWNFVKLEILRRTVLATLWSALWPAYLVSVAARIDNPFNLARNRSEKAGKILADALINKVQGERPVTLVGYSLGARVIYSCLKSLAERKAFGLVDTVVFIGAPAPSNRNHWKMMRSVVSGKMFNVYSENDYILAFMYRATSIQLGVAGLQGIKDIDGVENLNLSDEVKGHLRYPNLIAKILVRCGFPNIKGGEGPIEKEEDVVKVADGKEGTLIDLNDIPKEELAPVPVPVNIRPITRGHREISFPTGIGKKEGQPIITKRKADSVGAAQDPLQGSPAEPKTLGRLSESAILQQFMGNNEDAGTSSNNRPEEEPPLSPPPPPYSPGLYGRRDLPEESSPPGTTPKAAAAASIPAVLSAAVPMTADIDEDEDEGEDKWVGIQMVNNEETDLVSYAEPLRIEDD